MSIDIQDYGSGNRCRLDPEAFPSGAEIVIRGDGNTIEVGADINICSPQIHIEGNGNTIRLAAGLVEMEKPVLDIGAPFLLHVGTKPALVAVVGDDNLIETGRYVELYGSRMQIVGAENAIRLGDHVRAHIGVDFHTSGALFEVGDHTTCVGMQAALHEPRTLRLGKDCQLAADIYLTVSDTHSIVDLETGARINGGRDVTIGDHVWLGYRTVFLKGASVGSGSVIGTCAVVTGVIPENCVAVGNPARVTRENVTWARELDDFPNIKAAG